jgi:very-short-patch-repair endonuclease/ribosomal protein L37AE/L43A
MINLDENWKQENGKYKCPHCKKEFGKHGICTHIWRSHKDGKNFKPYKGKIGWNKGLTKENDKRIEKGVITFQKNLAEGKFIPSQTGRPLSEKHKNNVSKSMKKAHKEGRAWNIGMSRWNNKASYPEEFFMKVIENEFEDKNYKYEYPVGIYSLDFAWIEKKKVIEIDGEQHQRFEEYQERDKRKDEFLKNNNWQILRISWKDMCNETKQKIKICKEFINE